MGRAFLFVSNISHCRIEKKEKHRISRIMKVEAFQLWRGATVLQTTALIFERL